MNKTQMATIALAVLAIILGFLASLWLTKQIDQGRPKGEKIFPSFYSE